MTRDERDSTDVAAAYVLQQGDGGVATRLDRTNGTREEARFFGPEPQKMFGCTHLPASNALAGVVVCPSVQAEAVKNYRREVLLGRALAARGFAVHRFHYRGTGNSDGSGEDVTFNAMRADALAAAEFLQTRMEIRTLAFVGTRWGALLAASASARYPGSPVVLWEPAVDPSRYLREVIRYSLMRSLTGGSADRAPATAIEEQGTLDVLGYSVNRLLFDSAGGHTLTRELTACSHPVLLMQISRSKMLRSEYRSLMSAWCAAGSSVDADVVEDDVAWWLAGEQWQPEERRPMTDKLISRTAQWLEQKLPAMDSS